MRSTIFNSMRALPDSKLDCFAFDDRTLHFNYKSEVNNEVVMTQSFDEFGSSIDIVDKQTDFTIKSTVLKFLVSCGRHR